MKKYVYVCICIHVQYSHIDACVCVCTCQILLITHLLFVTPFPGLILFTNLASSGLARTRSKLKNRNFDK